MSRRLVLVIVAAVLAIACHKHRHYEKEEAGGAPKFHDQRLAPTIAVAPQADAPRPVALALDVSADAIHIDDGEHWTSYPRRGGGQPIVQPSRGRLIPVVGDDSLMAWVGERQIVAAHSNDLDHSWTVLDYAPEQAVAPPLVVAGRVAVVTTNAILHAPLDPSTNADGPGRLALGLTPKTPPRSDGRRLVWAAADGDREVIFASDGRFFEVQTIWTQPTEVGEIIDAAPVGSTVVFIHVDRWDGVEKTPLLRVRADGTIVQVLPGMLREPDEQLITDGDRIWQFARKKMFWWIGEHSHAFSRVVEDDVSAVAADDGVLVWQQADGLHVAGQPTIEFPTPVAQPTAPPEPSTPTPAPTPEPQIEPEPKAAPLARAPEPPLTEAQHGAGFGRFDKPMPAKVEWQRLPGLDELQKFHLLPLGVLADCELADYCELDEKGKLVASKFEIDDEPDPEELTGAWPDNTWFVDTEIDSPDVNGEPMGLETLLASKWTGKKWAKYKREFLFEAYVGDFMNNRVARAGWSGDLIVCHDSTGKAFNLRSPDKILATFGPNVVWALAQTATGKLLPFRRDDHDVRATSPCLGEDCKLLTHGPQIGMETNFLVLRVDVSRGGDAMSFLFEEGGLSDKQRLLHYEPAGPGDEPESWTFDTPSEERQIGRIWGDELGGLWMNIGGSELLYRSPKGLWFSVAPPEGFVFDSFAARAKPREFLAYASNPDDAAVFAVRGPITPAPEQLLVEPTPEEP